MHRYTIIVALPLVFILYLAAGCGKKQDGVVSREGEPDFVQVFDQDVMEAAIAEAKTTLETFESALNARDALSENFTIKKGYSYGGDEKEFIWIGDVRLAGTTFEGKINNEPVNDIGVKIGQTVLVKRDEVADWMFMSAGRLRGGYTIVALVYGTEEQKQYEQAMQIDWSQYKFLKIKK